MNATKSMRTRVVLIVAVLVALVVALAGIADPAEARKKKHRNPGQIVFASDRTTGEGVNNPTGDREIFVMKPDGTGVKQITFNTVNDLNPTLSPDGTKISYSSSGTQFSNPEGDSEIYLMNPDGTDQQNLTNTIGGIQDFEPHFSPDGKKMAYHSAGAQPSNPEGDSEVYLMDTDGTDQQNLTNTIGGILDAFPDFSPSGKKIAYQSFGPRFSNPEGDPEIYLMNALDGSEQRNLTDTAGGIEDFEPDFSPLGEKIAYDSDGSRSSNPEGDTEVYLMNALDGSEQRNLTKTGSGIEDFAPDFGKVRH